MFSILKNAWNTPDLRKKILFTLFIILLFRIGSAIPVPFLEPEALRSMLGSSNNIFGYIDLMTGGNFSRATLFALSITPYINASIIIQLLTVAIPPLERLAKNGEDGQKKIAKITRYTTVGLALILGLGYYFILRNYGALREQYMVGKTGFFVATIVILAFTAGSMLVMWLGDQITEKGVGNGISIILFAGILSRLPASIATLIAYTQLDPIYYFAVPLVLVLFAVIIYFIVVMTTAERRIPVQYAKRVVGRKMYGGQNSHIPLKVTLTGVLPIIFAGAILAIPSTIASFIDPMGESWLGGVASALGYTSPLYAVLYFLLIIAFNYFYVAVQYNPVEMANNLRKNNGGIPGIRPGKPTSDFISRILSKITLIGAVFLGLVAILPILFTSFTGMNIAIGGTSVIIVVGVALETAKTLESQLMMRHYKGFLE